MYLYHFERILRAASGQQQFALPYWNYAIPTEHALPIIFRQPADATNPLYVTARRTRDPNINGGEDVPAGVTDASNAFSFTNFASPNGSGLSFGGQILQAPRHFSTPHGRLEMQPHDIMHVVVGGSSWMSDPNFAARDPIFWLHHCNIDRLWNRWLSLGGGRANPVEDGVWMDQRFAFFDETGSMVQMSGRDIVESAQQLGYRYDDEPLPTPRVFVAASLMGSDMTSMAGAEDAAPTEAGVALPSVMRPPPFRCQPKVGRLPSHPRLRGSARSSSISVTSSTSFRLLAVTRAGFEGPDVCFIAVPTQVP